MTRFGYGSARLNPDGYLPKLLGRGRDSQPGRVYAWGRDKLDAKELTIAALLHDVGKVMYRGLAEARDHKISHQQLGYLWAQKRGLPESVREAIRRHHSVPRSQNQYEQFSPYAYSGDMELKNLLYLVCEADNIAAGMERDEYKEGAFDPSVPLGNIFSSIKLNGRPDAEVTSWPLKQGEYPIPNLRISDKEREDLWYSLEADLAEVIPFLEPSTLLYILQKHLSQFPEHSWVGKELPATSLYNHLKSTAAIALASYHYLNESGADWSSDQDALIRDRDQERYALVACDISGVQRFVYRVSSRRALRLLRARSFFLELLCESVASQLLRAAGLERPNLVYVGGGGFVILAPNTNSARAAMQKVVDKINSWLWSSFGSILYMTWAFVPTSGKALRENLADTWESLHSSLAHSKSMKWKGKLKDLFTPRLPGKHECDACQVDTDDVIETEDGELRLCRFCYDMLRLGAKLPEIRQLWEVPEEDGTILRFPGAGYREYGPGRVMYLLTDLWRNLTDSELKQPIALLPTAGLVTDKEMSSLGASALGASRVGILRMDVDNLGAIFQRGLERRSFARISDLSERLNLYFKCILPERIPEMTNKTSVFGPIKRELQINVVYAGGDDLFVLGPWDQMFDLAFSINEDFRCFTGNNPSVTLSAGLAVLDYRTAIQKAAGLAGEQESLAKHSGRNRLGTWGDVLEWEQRDKIASLLRAFRDDGSAGMYKLDFSKSLLYDLKLLLDSDDEFLLSKIYYLLRRADARKLFDPILSGLNDRWLRVALEAADLASRGGGHE